MSDDVRLSAEQKIVQGLEAFADALEAGDDIAEKFTCRKVVLDLLPEQYNPALVKDTRKKLRMSQALFAQYIGVSTSLVQHWEQGRKSPNPMACRFMDEIRTNPKYFRERLREMISPKASC